jgi:AbrB family looped-hinge helix DNA binding protein
MGRIFPLIKGHHVAKPGTHATVDNKGRVLIPDAIRKQLDINSGDVLFVQVEDTGAIRYMRAENPFDVLAEHALRESRAGRTRTLQEIAAELGVDLARE